MNQALDPMLIKKYWNDQIPPDINYLHQINQKFTDPYFPPNKNSLISCDKNGFYIDKLNGYENNQTMERKLPGLINRTEWKRATEIHKKWDLIGNNFEKRDILQGNIGDCYFLSALVALTHYPYLIAEKFRTKKFNNIGYYEMIFFIDGEWQIVFVDDYFPFDPSQDELVGARPNHNELWAILLEKAWVKLNGGYTNTFGGLFSEAISDLTGFPTVIFKHNKLETQKDLFNLYKYIEIGYKEGSIMACGTKTDGPGIDIFGLIPGHTYSIVYPQKWIERNLYLLKLKNPWGKNEWCGNWSDYSINWTEELMRYFQFTRKNDGTLWIDLNDFFSFFDNTYICHILYGALFKHFYFEYHNYFKRPAVFNLLLKQKAITSITILFKNWRFNRDLNNVSHPFCLLLCKYDQNRRIEKIWPKWDCEDEFNIVENLEPGYYCIWLYCPLNLIKGDSNFKYILQIASLSQYEVEFIGLDYDFSFIQYLVTDNYKIIEENKVNSSKNYLITSNDQLFKNGLFNTLIFNKSHHSIEISVTDDGIRNCQVLPPYTGMNSFKILVPPYENTAILGIRKSYDSGAFNLKFQTIFQIGGQIQWEILYPQETNIGERFANYLKFNISNNSPANNTLRSKEYIFIKKDVARQLPKFDSQTFSGEDSLRQSLLIDQDMFPEILIKDYPTQFNLLFKKYPKDISPNIPKKWTKLKNYNGTYIGQINSKNGELEGRGVFFWDIGTKYVGYLKKNNLQGNGILLDKNDKIIFEGYFFANKKNGYGRLYYGNGEYYEGDFIDNKVEGNGTYHFKNGDIWEGNFQNKKKNGIGIMIRKNYDYFLTEYEDDNFMNAFQLNSDEINYIEKLREKDKNIFLEKRKTNPMELYKLVNIKKYALAAASHLYKKKKELTSSIRVYY